MQSAKCTMQNALQSFSRRRSAEAGSAWEQGNEHMTNSSPYDRILLKLSGESIADPGQRGISMQEVVDIAAQVQRAAQLGVQIAIVIGGGNILRGAQF